MPRLHALDGLRGLAACIVVAHHVLLTLPGLAAQYLRDDPPATAWEYVVTYTPLHVFWEGPAAVYVFFVLSGVVLTLPTLPTSPTSPTDGRERFSWAAYYPQRLMRLYVPVWAAVLFGIALMTLIPRDDRMASVWLDDRALEILPSRVVRDLTLVWSNGGLVSPLWSLQWEILFSLLLPVFFVVGVRLVRWRWVVLAASVLLIAAGAAWRIEAMLYLPMFLLGVLMAASLPELLRVRERMPRAGAVVLTVLAPVLLVAPWLLGPSVDLGAVGRAVLETAAVIGAALMVVCAITVPFVQRALETPVLRWLGLISFSLYLVHEPVAIGFAFLLGDDLLPLAALLSVGVSVPLAWLFHRVIEVPSHRLARVVGSKVRARTSERAATTG